MVQSFTRPVPPEIELAKLQAQLEGIGTIERVTASRSVNQVPSPEPVATPSPYDDFLDLQEDAAQRGLSLTLDDIAPLRDGHFTYRLSGERGSSVFLGQDEVELEIEQTPYLSVGSPDSLEPEPPSESLIKKILGGAKSLLLGDTPAEMVISAITWAIPAALPLRIAQVAAKGGFKALWTYGKTSVNIGGKLREGQQAINAFRRMEFTAKKLNPLLTKGLDAQLLMNAERAKTRGKRFSILREIRSRTGLASPARELITEKGVQSGQLAPTQFTPPIFSRNTRSLKNSDDLPLYTFDEGTNSYSRVAGDVFVDEERYLRDAGGKFVYSSSESTRTKFRDGSLVQYLSQFDRGPTLNPGLELRQQLAESLKEEWRTVLGSRWVSSDDVAQLLRARGHVSYFALEILEELGHIAVRRTKTKGIQVKLLKTSRKVSGDIKDALRGLPSVTHSRSLGETRGLLDEGIRVGQGSKAGTGAPGDDIVEAFADDDTLPSGLFGPVRHKNPSTLQKVAVPKATPQDWNEVLEATDEAVKYGITRRDFGAIQLAIKNSSELNDAQRTPLLEDVYNLFVLGVDVPPASIRDLGKVFGVKFGTELKKANKAFRLFRTVGIEAFYIPKSIKSSLDASAILRQGLVFSASRPGAAIRATKTSFKAMFNEEYYQEMQQTLHKRKWSKLHLESMGVNQKTVKELGGSLEIGKLSGDVGLDITGDLVPEDAFISNWTRLLPGVRESERFFVTFLNLARAEMFDSFIGEMIRGGGGINRTLATQMAKYANVVTGRGQFGKTLTEFLPAANAVFYSPRLVYSRFQMPLVYLESAPAVRKVIAADLARTVTRVGALAGAAVLAGARFELDPRSSDFGKLRVGNSRFDLFAGYPQVGRVIVQALSGQRKTVTSEKIAEADRLDVMARFIQYKMSPSAGLISDIVSRQTFLGEDFVVKDLATVEQIKERLAPLILNDLEDALREYGPWGVPKTIPAFFGVGIQTYVNLWDRRREVFAEMFPGEDFRDRYGREGRALLRVLDSHEKVSAEIQTLRERGALHDQSYIRESRRRWEAQNTLAEADFRAALDAGLVFGEPLRDTVQEFLRERFIRAETLFLEMNGETFTDTGELPVPDALAMEYYGAELHRDPATGRLDFDARDQARSVVLAKAEQYNVHYDYIIGNGPTSFRGNRFGDPIVRRYINRYESDIDSMREYWDVEEGLITPYIRSHMEQMQIAEAGGDLYVLDRLGRAPNYRAFQKRVQEARARLLKANPELEARLIFWGYRDVRPDPVVTNLVNDIGRGLTNPQ